MGSFASWLWNWSLEQMELLLHLQSQLRTNLITELQQSVQGPLTLRDLEPSESDPLLLRAANSLVADHLQKAKYEYTLGVFLPESGLAQDKVSTGIFSFPGCNIGKTAVQIWNRKSSRGHP